MKSSTRLVSLGRTATPDPGFVNPPLVRGSTVLHAGTADMEERVRRAMAGDDSGPVTYGRHGNPTNRAFLDAVTALEEGHRSWALPSGLAACTCAILAYVRAGDHVLVTDAAYGPTRKFCQTTLAAMGVETTFYDPLAGAAVAELMRPNTRVLYAESPGSLTFEMQDLPALAAAARARGVVCVVDNTWATPLYCQPLRLGADVVVHAVTKYIGGHADLFLGTVTCTEAAWGPLRRLVSTLGLTAGPDDCWLALRGLRSLGARLRQHRATADRLVQWLGQQPEVARLRYPALAADPGHALWQRDCSGATGLFGVELQARITATAAHRLVDATTRFGHGYSWGGFESLLIPSHPERSLAGAAPSGPLLRISAGLEDAEDLVEDLDQAFARMRSAA